MEHLMSKIYIIYADNHDYDAMSYWFSANAFLTMEAAEQELKRMEEEYWKANPGSKRRGFPNIEVIEFELKE